MKLPEGGNSLVTETGTVVLYSGIVTFVGDTFVGDMFVGDMFVYSKDEVTLMFQNVD